MSYDEDVRCPVCGGPCWDRRLTKRNPKAPDFICRDLMCDGVIMPAPTRGNAMDANAYVAPPKVKPKADPDTGELF